MCFFVNKKINQFAWKTYITNRPNIINLYFNLPNRCIYIYNFYNLVNIKKTSINILILKYRLDAHLNKEHIIHGDFNFYYKA